MRKHIKNPFQELDDRCKKFHSKKGMDFYLRIITKEDTFRKCISFMKSHSDCGGLGVKMVDGAGKFLPESKRSLPTPKVSFYKIFGLSSLFPKSKKFGKYHLTYLNKDETKRAYDFCQSVVGQHIK